MLKLLTNKVYYMPHYSETDRPTLGLVCGKNFSLIVDAGNSPAHALEFIRSVEKMDVAEPKFVVITHWHWDHVFGIETMGFMTISHEDTKKKIEYMKSLKWDDDSLDERVVTGEEIAFCRDMIKRELPTRSNLKLKAPDITFQQKMEIDLGEITCIVEHVGGEHAEDSSIIYIPEEKVMFLGDCIYQDFYSGEWSYDLAKLNLLLDKIKKYDANYYVTGHQAPKTKEEMWNFLYEIVHIGQMVEDEVNVEKAVETFRSKRGVMPNEEQLEFIQHFINGNEKKEKK